MQVLSLLRYLFPRFARKLHGNEHFGFPSGHITFVKQVRRPVRVPFLRCENPRQAKFSYRSDGSRVKGGAPVDGLVFIAVSRPRDAGLNWTTLSDCVTNVGKSLQVQVLSKHSIQT